MTIAVGGTSYHVDTRVLQEAVHFYGEEAESKIVERFAEYRVNSERGSGIIEWQFRNHKK